jgi:ferric-dicitrate binding protein FerR (iron transport regulator)
MKDPLTIKDNSTNKTMLLRRLPYMAAASVIVILAIALIFRPAKNVVKEQTFIAKAPVAANKQIDVEPGGNKAILTLADGSKVLLDDAKVGRIAEQGGVNISKTEDGKLVYVISPAAHDQNAFTLLYNKIETPRGGQYQIDLPDGSRVWLNAASVLKFPAVFRGDERLVELTGEAFFEVSPNKLMPFKIQTQSQTVEVLGTRFNINSYSNELDVKTTLVEGSVKISGTSTNQVTYLKPGQQAINSNHGPMRLITVNTDQMTAWKSGRFVFNDMELENIMRQLERWYDVEVDYSKIPKISYNAHISMGLKLSKVLETLEITGGIKFKIDGRKIKILEAK